MIGAQERTLDTMFKSVGAELNEYVAELAAPFVDQHVSQSLIQLIDNGLDPRHFGIYNGPAGMVNIPHIAATGMIYIPRGYFKHIANQNMDHKTRSTLAVLGNDKPWWFLRAREYPLEQTENRLEWLKNAQRRKLIRTALYEHQLEDIHKLKEQWEEQVNCCNTCPSEYKQENVEQLTGLTAVLHLAEYYESEMK